MDFEATRFGKDAPWRRFSKIDEHGLHIGVDRPVRNIADLSALLVLVDEAGEVRLERGRPDVVPSLPRIHVGT
jgi:hypothetical protein